jgi:hypothetical protein
VLDVHNHLGRWLGDGDWLVPDVPALIDLVDEVGVATIVNLDGRWGDELDANLARYDRPYPDRFLTFAHLDWTRLHTADPTTNLIADLHRARDAGARGLKVWKDLGLRATDGAGQRVRRGARFRPRGAGRSRPSTSRRRSCPQSTPETPVACYGPRTCSHAA